MAKVRKGPFSERGGSKKEGRGKEGKLASRNLSQGRFEERGEQYVVVGGSNIQPRATTTTEKEIFRTGKGRQPYEAKKKPASGLRELGPNHRPGANRSGCLHRGGKKSRLSP